MVIKLHAPAPARCEGRRAFTLVEMLIAMAVTLILMTALATGFSFVGQSELPMERIRPTNVGFGLSYVSSVIITCLISKPGDLIIVENPEAHLHTKGQRAITDLLIRTAQAGVQVICESHSRELLYCTRQRVLDQTVSPDLVSVLYVHAVGNGNRGAESWNPLTKPIYELGAVGDNFLEYFGAPTDFIQPVGQ